MYIITYGRFANRPQDVRQGVGVYAIEGTAGRAEKRAIEFREKFPGEPVAVHDTRVVWPVIERKST